MTERVKGCWVAFDHDIREDDVEATTDAIKMIKNVSDVELTLVDHADWMNRTQIRLELKKKLWEALG